MGLLAFKQNNYPIAETLFVRAIKLNPNFKLLWENLAKCYRLQNKFIQAKKAFQNLLKLDPHNYEAMGALGTIHIRLSDFDEGIRIYKELLTFNEKNPRVHLSLGHAQKTVGSRTDSESSYLNAIKYFKEMERYRPNSILSQIFFQSKNLEIFNILNTNKIEKIDEVISDLNNIAPFFSNQWNNLN